MKFKAGVVQVLLLLLTLSVIAVSSVAIMAQQKNYGRALSIVNAPPNPRPTPRSCDPIGGKLHACKPTIRSVVPNPIPVGVPTVIATFIKVSGTGFGRTKGQVQFLFQPCSSDTSPHCLAPDSIRTVYSIWNCDIGKSPAEWTDSKIVCAQPSGLPANQTLELSVHTSDNRVSKPFSVSTLYPNPSATPILIDDRCLVPPGTPLPPGCPTL